MSISEEEIIRIYGKRWGIEVFFKMCKSYLKLGKETQSMGYDAMNAYVAIVFSRYIMLSIEARLKKDERGFGELFYRTCDGLRDITFDEAVHLLFSLMAGRFDEFPKLPEERIEALLEEFVSSVRNLLQQVLQKRT